MWACGCLLPKWLSPLFLPSGAKTFVISYQQLKNRRVLLLVKLEHLTPPGSPCPGWQLPGAGVGRAWTCPSSAVSTQPTSPVHMTCPHPRHTFLFFFFYPLQIIPFILPRRKLRTPKGKSTCPRSHKGQKWSSDLNLVSRLLFQGSFSSTSRCQIMFLTAKP